MYPNGPLKPAALPSRLAWSIFGHSACLDRQSSWIKSSAKRIPFSLHTGDAFEHLQMSSLTVRCESFKKFYHLFSDVFMDFLLPAFNSLLPPSMLIQTSADDPECSSTYGLQPAQKGTCHPAAGFSSLASSSSQNQIQGTCLGSQNNHKNCSSLPGIPDQGLLLLDHYALYAKDAWCFFSSVVTKWWNELPNCAFC